MTRRVVGSLVALALLLAVVGSAGSTLARQTSGGEPTRLRIGVSPVPHGEIVRFVAENLAPAAGLELEVIEFTDYVQPNLALADGELDANFFQHVPYMEDFAAERGLDLVAVAAVHVEPLGVYSNEFERLEETPDEAVVAIPNDVTNAGRALRLLADNGLIGLDPAAGIAPTVDDVVDNPKQLEIVELEAAQLPRSLEDAALSVINGNYAIEAGLDPTDDALALESAENNPYANVLAVEAGRENEPAIRTLAQLLTSPDVRTFIEETYRGAVIPIAPSNATPASGGTPTANS